MKSFVVFCSLYKTALRLAFLYLRKGKIRRGFYLLIRPIDYWRVFEFIVTYDFLRAQSGERILDASSPKLLSMLLASKIGANIFPIDIYDDGGLSDTKLFNEGTPNSQLNIDFGDMRHLQFPDASFNKVFTISVLEHVFPPVGGDVTALRELTRVLKDEGILVVTVPFSKKHVIENINADVYERKRNSTDEQLFYQRRYDEQSLSTLIAAVPELIIERQEYVCERFFHMEGKELWKFIGEGNKAKRLLLAPFYPLFSILFLKRTSIPLPSSDYMMACLKLRKVVQSNKL